MTAGRAAAARQATQAGAAQQLRDRAEDGARREPARRRRGRSDEAEPARPVHVGVEDDRIDVARAWEGGSGGVQRRERRQHDVALLGVGELVLAMAALRGRRAELVGDEPRVLGPQGGVDLCERVAERRGVQLLRVRMEAEPVGRRDRAVAGQCAAKASSRTPLLVSS